MSNLFVEAARLVAVADRTVKGRNRAKRGSEGQVKTGDNAKAPAALRAPKERKALRLTPGPAGVVEILLHDLIRPTRTQDGIQDIDEERALLIGIEVVGERVRCNQPGIRDVRSEQHSFRIGNCERISSVLYIHAVVPVETHILFLSRGK